MSSLWRKEFRAALPFLCLVVIVPALSASYELFNGLPNLKPWETTFEDYVSAHHYENSLVFFVLVMALTSGVLIREYDEGTLEFLDSLPVSRTRIFLTKICVALLALLVYILLDVGTTLMLHALSRDSLHQSFHVRFCVTAIALRCCQGFILFSLGLSCAYLRRFGWLLIGLLFWVYVLLHERQPWMEVLNVFALLTPAMEGQRWIIPQRLLIVQMTVGVSFLLLSYGLFLGAGDVLMRGFRRLTQTRVGNAFLISGGGAMALAAFSVLFFVMESHNESAGGFDDDIVTIEYPSWSTSRARTDQYNFVYPTNMEGRVLPLVESAEGVHAKVRTFFDAEPGGQVLVDATNKSARHAGLAYWDKILLDPTATDDGPALEAVLGHETAHVFLDRLSDNRLHDTFESTRFFHEGVATYVECHLFNPLGGVARWRRVAAVMRDRNEVRFEELVDNSALAARLDPDVVYPLGEVFVAELAEQFGQASIGKLARAFVRKDAPEGLSGMQLWRDVFRACGYDLGTVLDGFYARLDNEVQLHRDFIDQVPNLRAAVETQSGFVILRLLELPADPWQVICRVRQSADSPPHSYMNGLMVGPGSFFVDRDNFPRSVMWYQLGVQHPDARPIYEPWIQIRLQN